MHYVPLARDLSDVEEKIQWARDHDDEVCVHVCMRVCACTCTCVHVCPVIVVMADGGGVASGSRSGCC